MKLLQVLIPAAAWKSRPTFSNCSLVSSCYCFSVQDCFRKQVLLTPYSMFGIGEEAATARKPFRRRNWFRRRWDFKLSWLLFARRSSIFRRVLSETLWHYFGYWLHRSPEDYQTNNARCWKRCYTLCSSIGKEAIHTKGGYVNAYLVNAVKKGFHDSPSPLDAHKCDTPLRCPRTILMFYKQHI